MKKSPGVPAASQALIWGAGWLLMLLLLSKEDIDFSFWYRSLLIIAGVSVVVFVNLRWLIPNLYLQKKRASYFFASTALLLMVVWGVHSDFLPWNRGSKESMDRTENIAGRSSRPDDDEAGGNFRWLLRNLPPLFISLLGSSLVAVSRYASEKEKEAMQFEKAKLETEVKFLKSQINPHFLFNALHNIYALTVIKPERASENLLKLSDMLRYMLYDSNEERVPLEREVEYLKSYVELAQLKESRGLDVQFEVGEDYHGLKVAPLLFIPFVENAFKHSQIEDLKNGYVHISLNIKGRKLLFFEVVNSKAQRTYTKDQQGGIGLDNVRQRLDLLYPERHQLAIHQTEATFNIHLELDCS